MINSHHALHALIEHLVSLYKATPNFDSTESGEKITANFEVSINNFDGELHIVSEEGEWFRNNYPDGFEILRISNYQQFEIPMSHPKKYSVCFSMEMLKKSEQVEEEVIEDEDGTTISTRNKSVVAAYLGEGHEERFANFSDAHKTILNKQMDLLHDLFALSSKVSAK